MCDCCDPTSEASDPVVVRLERELEATRQRLASAEASQEGEVAEFNAGYKHAMDCGSVHDQPYDCPYDVWEIGFAWAMWNKEKNT